MKENTHSNKMIGCCEENQSDLDGVADSEDSINSVAAFESLTEANVQMWVGKKKD